MPFPRLSSRTDTALPGAVVELRQYTLHPGRRDALVALFEREFIETQEACGLHVLGQFRDLDRADRFVWLRGFTDMGARRHGLHAFYGGPVWAAHREAANATMIDSDDVRLLRPAWPGAGVVVRAADRAPRGTTSNPPGAVGVMVWPLDPPADAPPIGRCREALVAALRASGASATGVYATEPAANDFPRLPVREGEPVLVALAVFPGVAALDAWPHALRGLHASLRAWRAGAPETLRLAPTPRSALHA